MAIKMIVADFDRTMTFGGIIEPIARWILRILGLDSEKIFRILFRVQEILDLFKPRNFLFKNLNYQVVGLLLRAYESGLLLGLLTDRRKCFICNLMDRISLGCIFSFVQGRSSIDNNSHCSSKNTICFDSKRIKPHPIVFLRLCDFAKERGIPRDQILILEDQADTRKIAEKLGFLTMDPLDPKMNHLKI